MYYLIVAFKIPVSALVYLHSRNSGYLIFMHSTAKQIFAFIILLEEARALE
jgi:hypothetical protein